MWAIKTSVIIGLLIITMVFPMVMIPVMGIGVVIWGIYELFHVVTTPKIQHHS